jgi:hypothetical protein
MWPPDEEEWGQLLKGLPIEADRSAVCQAVMAAVWDYVENAGRDRARGSDLSPLKKQIKSKAFKKLNQCLHQISDRGNIPEQLRQFIDLAREIPATVDQLVELYLPSTRRERLLSSLSLAWTGPGKGAMPVSETGAFAEFLCGIADRVLRRSLSVHGAKAFVKREKLRRAIVGIIRLSGEGGMKADAFLIDASSQPKTD